MRTFCFVCLPPPRQTLLLNLPSLWSTMHTSLYSHKRLPHKLQVRLFSLAPITPPSVLHPQKTHHSCWSMSWPSSLSRHSTIDSKIPAPPRGFTAACSSCSCVPSPGQQHSSVTVFSTGSSESGANQQWLLQQPLPQCLTSSGIGVTRWARCK